MNYKKYIDNYQNTSQRAQKEGYLILTIDELIKRAIKLKGLNDEVISSSAIIRNPYKEEIKISGNFTNEYFLKPENFYKCSVQINAKEYDTIKGETMSINDFNSNLEIISLDDEKNFNDAIDNEILNKLTTKGNLKNLFNLYKNANIYEINVDLGFSKTSFGIFTAIPIGLNSKGFCKGTTKEPCRGKLYLAKKKS